MITWYARVYKLRDTPTAAYRTNGVSPERAGALAREGPALHVEPLLGESSLASILATAR